MYAAHFGLKENPFNLTPDPQYFYLSPRHQEALNSLIYGIHERKGFMLLTGDVGNGKTTLCRTLLSRLDGSMESALIFNPSLSDLELLQSVNREFGVTLQRGRQTKKRCLDALNNFLLKTYSSGKQAILIIDEAQNLSHSVLEQIRMLSNLETDRDKLLQIILMGQPELQSLLALPSLRQLNERITVRYHLPPLDRPNMERYIAFRLARAGGENTVRFTPGAYHTLFECTGGNPRRINALCDRSLLVAYADNVTVVTKGIVRKAVRDIGEDYFLRTRQRHSIARLLLLSLLLLLAAALLIVDRLQF